MNLFQMHDIEVELEAERGRGRDLVAENRKLQRLLQEVRTQSEEDHRLVAELTDQNTSLQLKIRSLRRLQEEGVFS